MKQHIFDDLEERYVKMTKRLFSSFKKHGAKAIVFLLVAAMVIAFLPPDPGSYAAFDNTAIEQKTGAVDNVPALSDGQIWTGKSVDADPSTPEIIDLNVNPAQDDKFGVTLSALGQDYSEEVNKSEKVNVVFVLDISGSMEDDNKIRNAVEALNSTISLILGMNSSNKVGVTTFAEDETPFVDLTHDEFSLSVGQHHGSYYVENSKNDNEEWVSGGTNIQIGMNRGYRMVRDAKNQGDTAKPILIVLTDGVPNYGCEYYSNFSRNIYTNWYFRDGNGKLNVSTGHNGNGMDAAACTILQAAYMKTQMPELKLYTVGYDTGDNHLATAVLDPTPANIAVCDGGNYYNLDYLLDYYKSKEETPEITDYHYPTESYFGTVDTEALTKALAGFVTEYTSHSPLASGTDLVIADTIPNDFMLSSSGSLVVNLGGTNYTLTKTSGIYTNASLYGLTATIASGVLTWTIPANMLPSHGYNTDGELTTVNPITLKFLVELNNVTEAGTYKTNNGANGTFTPIIGNPYYYTSSSTAKDIEGFSNGVMSIDMPNTGKIKLKSVIADLVISKNVTTYGGFDKDNIPAADIPNSGFEFKLNIGTSNNTFSAEIFDNLTAAGTPVSTMSIPSSNAIINLPDGYSVKISSIGIGTTYSITETNSGNGFATSITLDNGNAVLDNNSKTATGTIQANSGNNPGNTIEFNNLYYPSVSIPVSKTITTLYESVEIPAGAIFNFGLYSQGDADHPIPGTTTSITTATSNDRNYTTSIKVRLDKLTFVDNKATVYVHETPGGSNGDGWSYDSGFYPVTITKDPITVSTVGYENGRSSFVNRYEPMSQLTLTKFIGSGDPDRDFSFNVSINGTANYSYTVTGTRDSKDDLTPSYFGSKQGTGALTLNNILLSNNQYIVISNIPVGTPYTITEDDYSTIGYVSSILNNGVNQTSGTIVLDDHPEDDNINGTNVCVTNEFDTGALIVSKTVSNTSRDDTFTFTVKMNGAAFSDYTYIYADEENGFDTSATPMSPNTNGAFTLSGGQSVMLLDLPAGASYTVREMANDSYMTMVTTDGGTSNDTANYATVNGLPIGTNDAPQIDFTNTYKTGSLTVSKDVLVNNGQTSDDTKYTIQVTFTGSYLSEITCSNETATIDNSNGLTFTVQLADDESITFSQVPDGTSYMVQETDSNSANNVFYNGQDVTYYSDTFLYSSTSGNAKCVKITNNFMTEKMLTIAKSVDASNNSSDFLNTPFDFEISFNRMEDVETEPAVYDEETKELKSAAVIKPQQVPYTLDSSELPNDYADLGFAPKEGIKGCYTFSLMNGQSLVFDKLPENVMFTVKELDDMSARDSSAAVTGTASVDDLADDLTVSGTITWSPRQPDAISILYTNDYHITPGSLTLKKTVKDPAGVSPNLTYDFTVKFTEQANTIIPQYNDKNALVDYDAKNDVFNVTLKPFASVTFEGLLPGTKYVISELDTADKTKMNGKTGSSYTGVMSTKQNDSYTVEEATVVCNNFYEPPKTETVKEASVDSIVKGNDVTYTVTVKNIGKYDVELSNIKDTLLDSAVDGSITFNGSTDGFEVKPAGSNSAKLLLDNSLTLEKGATATLQYTVHFNDIGEKYNKATSVAYYKDYKVKSCDDALVTVYPPSSIDVEKYVSIDGGTNFNKTEDVTTVNFKDTLTYKITAENNNEATLFNPQVNDPMFVNMDKGNLTVTYNGNDQSFELDAGTGTVTFPADLKLNPSDVIVITYNSNANFTDPYKNTATAKAFDMRTTVTDTDSVTVNVYTPSITVTKTAIPTWALVEDTVHYTLTVANGYNQPLDMLSVYDNMFIPALNGEYSLDNIAVTADGSIVDYSLDPDTGIMTFVQNDDESSELTQFSSTVVITYDVTFLVAGDYSNSATAKASFRGWEVTDETDAAVTVHIADPLLGILVNKLVNGSNDITVPSGTTVTYTASLENTSNTPLTDITFTDGMFTDSSFTLVSIVQEEGGVTTDITSDKYSINGEIISFSDDLPVGAIITITYTATLTATRTNTVTGTAFFARDEKTLEASDTARVNILVTPYIPPVTPPTTPTTTPSESPSPSPSESASPSPTETDQAVLGSSDVDDSGDDGTGVAGDSDVLPQTGGISPSTLLGIFGLALISIGSTALTILKKKANRNSKSK